MSLHCEQKTPGQRGLSGVAMGWRNSANMDLSSLSSPAAFFASPHLSIWFCGDIFILFL